MDEMKPTAPTRRGPGERTGSGEARRRLGRRRQAGRCGADGITIPWQPGAGPGERRPSAGRRRRRREGAGTAPSACIVRRARATRAGLAVQRWGYGLVAGLHAARHGVEAHTTRARAAQRPGSALPARQGAGPVECRASAGHTSRRSYTGELGERRREPAARGRHSTGASRTRRPAPQRLRAGSSPVAPATATAPPYPFSPTASPSSAGRRGAGPRRCGRSRTR